MTLYMESSYNDLALEFVSTKGQTANSCRKAHVLLLKERSFPRLSHLLSLLLSNRFSNVEHATLWIPFEQFSSKIQPKQAESIVFLNVFSPMIFQPLPPSPFP